MARRRQWRRTGPDMGWILGSAQLNLIKGSVNDQSTISTTLFDFADIDAEALTGRIEADKSDWFIKRCILHMTAAGSYDGLNQSDWFRQVAWGIGTVGVEDATQINAIDAAIFGPEWQNLMARVFRTGMIPAYMPGLIPYGVVAETGDTRIAVTSASGSEAAGWLATGPFFGPGYQNHDFQVSNAGLRNNQAVNMFASTFQMNPYFWDEGDTARIQVAYQILLQKRRV